MHETNSLLLNNCGHPIRPTLQQDGRNFSLLSFTTKMPGPSWSIPASACKRGALLAKQENTICSNCYALKNRYRFPNVQRTLEARLKHFNADRAAWVTTISYYILALDAKHFRWFDSGDLQDPDMLERIMDVCEQTPDVKHWLPTRERSFLKDVIQRRKPPRNLTIRLSATWIDGPPLKIKPEHQEYVQTSTVSKTDFTCPASLQGNICGTCRKCWDREVSNVSYRLH